MTDIDSIKLAFDPASLKTLNVVLGLVMFGVAIDLRVEDFRRILRSPKAPLIGLVVQFLILPAAAFLLTLALRAPASIALGMIMVAACPGGNLSNFFTHLAKGSTATSVSMTAVSTVLAVFMTPTNFQLWASLHPGSAGLLKDVSVGYGDMFQTILVLLGLPLFLGMLTRAKLPKVADALRKPFKLLSLLFFAAFVVIAFMKNVDAFFAVIDQVIFPVAVMNAVALALGYGAAKLIKLGEPEARAVSIEVGIQNSGLGLILVFGFFDGLGGMACVAAWWGIWHIIVGLTLAGFWARRPVR